MYLDQRTKKFLKAFALVAVVFVLVGCPSNLEQNGQLIASRAINESTPWSLKNLGFFDFILNTVLITKKPTVLTVDFHFSMLFSFLSSLVAIFFYFFLNRVLSEFHQHIHDIVVLI